MKWPFLCLLFGALCFSYAEEPTRFEVYPLGGADLESTLEAVRLFVGAEGHVTPDPVHQRLLVVTTAERHARIADLFKKLAGPTRNVFIEVLIQSAEEERDAGLSAETSGRVALDRNGLSGTIRLQPRVHHQSTARTGFTTQSLLVGSGREAVLQVGESVPYIEWISEFGLRRGILQTRLAWQQVGSFLVVQPTIIGDGPSIRVRITPELRGLVDGRPERVRFSSVTTDVIVNSGESIDLGGMSQHGEFVRRFLVGRDSGGAARSLSIRLIPRIPP